VAGFIVSQLLTLYTTPVILISPSTGSRGASGGSG